jgi:ribosomal protein S18 acetylase RimI-like enzyme
MAITLATPQVAELDTVIAALRDWQHEGAPMQLHPGDIGWFWRFGAEATAAAIRTWSRGGRMLAVGLLDGADLLRMTTAPDARDDEELAHQLTDDISDPARDVLPAGEVYVEAPQDALLQQLLAGRGWPTDEPWTPLHRDLTAPVEISGIRFEVVGPELADVRAEIQRASFVKSTFTGERWRVLASGIAYSAARCLLAFDEHGTPVAAITVWCAGPGKPGLIEPMAVHPDHRGHGYGRAITVAGAAVLRELGSSSAIVCTESSNLGGVATYRSAGFDALPEVRDRKRIA